MLLNCPTDFRQKGNKFLKKEKKPQLLSEVFWSQPSQSLRLTLCHQLRVTRANGQGWEVSGAASASSIVCRVHRKLLKKPRGNVT